MVNANEVTCTGTINALNIDGRDLADTVTLVGTTVPATVFGGAGDDVLNGGGAIDTINGGADADRHRRAAAATTS